MELLSFPSYILLNHGEAWNQLGWTYPIVLPVVLLGYWCERWFRQRLLGWKFQLNAFDPEMVLLPRAWCCELAIVGFIAAAVEEFIHLIYAQVDAPVEWGFFAGLFGVIILANGLPMAVQFWIWSATIHRRNGAGGRPRDGPVRAAVAVALPVPAEHGVVLLLGRGLLRRPRLCDDRLVAARRRVVDRAQRHALALAVHDACVGLPRRDATFEHKTSRRRAAITVGFALNCLRRQYFRV